MEGDGAHRGHWYVLFDAGLDLWIDLELCAMIVHDKRIFTRGPYPKVCAEDLNDHLLSGVVA